MRDFDLLGSGLRRSEVHEQTRASTIYGRTEAGDITRDGAAWGDGERGVPTAQPGALGCKQAHNIDHFAEAPGVAFQRVATPVGVQTRRLLTP
jgi:hypothetical protein